MARLELSFLGPFQVRLEGRPVTSFEADKVRALLVYLAVEASRPHRREQLASLFWPGWPDASACAMPSPTCARPSGMSPPIPPSCSSPARPSNSIPHPITASIWQNSSG
jgi:hypothetical protein